MSPQQSIPPRTSARLVLAFPLASTGSTSAASRWLDSPHYLTGQSGRNKGIFSYQLEQVWSQQRRAEKQKDNTLTGGPYGSEPKIFLNRIEPVSSHMRNKFTGHNILSLFIVKATHYKGREYFFKCKIEGRNEL